jgi:small subunit ribosomal protein S17
MAEEEKQQAEETAEESAEEAPAEDRTPEAEAAQQPEAEVEEAEVADETEPAEPADAPEPEAAEAAEPEDELSPKQRRKRERSRAPAEAGPQRGPGERAADRREGRRIASERRRRYRTARRGKRTEPRQGTAPAERQAGSKKVRQGTVISAAADKTITVEIPVVRRHPAYEKIVRRSSKLHAHDESNQAQEGDVVRVIESRPLSRTKRWRLLEVVERSR